MGLAHGGNGTPEAQTIASPAKGAPKKRTLRVLLSFFYYADEDLDVLLDRCFEGIELDIFADSGAYSAWSVGKPVVEEAYVEWVERWKHRFTAVCGPDVIGDPQATFSATQRMMSRVSGIPVLPTFHVREDWSWLARCAAMSDYIAFGGMVPYVRQRRLLTSWCRKAFGLLPDHVRVHGFGMTTWELLRGFPWYSVDSSSWTTGFRYAILWLFDAARSRMVSVNMADRHALLAETKLLESYGLRPTEVQARAYDRDRLCGICIDSWQRCEAFLSTPRMYMVSASGSPGANNSPDALAAGLRTIENP